MTLQIPDMESAFYALVQQIPEGYVTTYGALAKALGDVRAARWVGKVAGQHPHRDAAVPGCRCHRIVRSDGTLGGYVGGSTAKKSELLRDEGALLASGNANLNERYFDAFTCDQPLAKLREYQQQIASEICLQPMSMLRQIGGIDVSYRGQTAYATYVCVDAQDLRLVWHETISVPVIFPYISSYLAFRELPVYAELISRVKRDRDLPKVTVVDGSGVLHPRRCGIATMLGITEGLATIGCHQETARWAIFRPSAQHRRFC